MGSTTNLTDQFGRVVGRADYNEWGQITYKDALDITSSYRRIYPQLSYTGHDWDDVLGMYYAKARFYDADTKRFVAIDPIKGSVTDPLSLVSYIYCEDNPLRWVDPLGLISYYIYEKDMFESSRGTENIAGMWTRALKSEYSTPAYKHAVTSWEDFKDFWNNLDDAEGIDAVVINIHGKPTELKVGGRFVLLSELSELAGKKVDMVILLSCNAGHLNYSDNVAQRLASLKGVNKVVADDGTTNNWYWEPTVKSLGDEMVDGRREREWVIYRDASNDVTSNYCYTYGEELKLICGGMDEKRSSPTGNAGWIMYQDGYRVQIANSDKIQIGTLIKKGHDFDVYDFDLTQTKEYLDARTQFQNTLAWKLVLNRFSTLDEVDIVTAWMKSSHNLYDTVQLLKELEVLQSEE